MKKEAEKHNRNDEETMLLGAPENRAAFFLTGWIFLFCVVVLALVAGGFLYYKSEETRIKSEKIIELAAIGKMKVDQILRWRKERSDDSKRIVDSPAIRKLVDEWFRDPGKIAEDLKTRLQLEMDLGIYSRAFWISTDHKILFSTTPQPIAGEEHLWTSVDRALAERDPVLSELYGTSLANIHMDIVNAVRDKEGRALAVLVLNTNAAEYLFPMIQSWPTPSRTSETLLVRREGDEVLYLNDLRHVKDTALKLRIPLSHGDLPAARAILGKTGGFFGKDYRGVEVLADVRPVSGTSWYLVSKVDAKEILAEVYYRAIVIAIIVGCLTLGSVVVIVLLTQGQRIEERRRAELVLWESQRKLLEAQRIAQLGYWEWDIKTGSVEWSEEVFNIFHLNPKEFIPKIDSILSLSPWPEDHERDKELIRRTLESREQGSYEQRFLRPDKSIGYYSSSFQGRYDERGDLVSIFGTVMDITERKQMEKERLESEERYRSLFEHAPLGYQSLDEGGNFIEVNQAWLETLGYKREEVLGRWFGDFLAPEFVAAFRGRFSLFKTEGKIHSEFEMLHKNGGRRLIAFEGRIGHKPDGSFRQTHCILADITEVKKTENELAFQRTFLTAVLENLDAAVIACNEKGELTLFNRAARDWQGLDPANIPQEEWAHHYALFMQDGVTLMDVHTVPLARAFRGERVHSIAMVIAAKGQPKRSIIAHASPIEGNDGRILGAVTVMHDVSEREKSEALLRESEAKYRFLLESSPMRIFAKDKDLRYVACNDVYAKSLGILSDEIVGKDDFVFHPRELAEKYRADDAKAMSSGHREVIEEKYFLKGEERWARTTKVPTRFENGEISGVLGIFEDITEQKHLEEAKHQAEERYRELVEGTDDLITIVDDQGRFTYVNHTSKKIFGIDPEDCVGRLAFDFIHPEDRGRTMKAFESWVREKKKQVVFQNRQVHKDGQVFEILWNINLRFNDSGEVVEISNFARDITELKRAEEAVASSEQRLRSIIENADEVIYTLSWDGVFTFVSQAWTRIVGHPVSEVIGRSFVPFVHPEDVEACMRFLKLTKESGRPQRGVEYRVKKTDGEWVWFTSAGATICDANGNPDYYVGVANNITERKKAAEALQKMNQELEERVRQRTAELSAAIKELEAFSYSVSHDLKAPLRAMTGFANILAEDYAPKLDENGRRVIQVIGDNARTMGQLIDELLKLSRLGRKQIEAVDIDMTALAQSVYHELKEELFHDRAVEMSVKPLPPARADATIVRQIFANLISNAMKFTARREKTVIEIGSYDQEGELVYYVKDNGVGFDMKYAAKLFEVFQRLHPQDEFEGTGVGLAIVRSSAMRHGGRVWVEAAVDQGATFYFTLSGRKNSPARSS